MRLTILDPCDEPWEAMAGSDLTRRCARCDKPVHDLAARAEAEALGTLALFGAGGICIRIRTDERGETLHVPEVRPRPPLAAVAASMAITIATGCAPPAPAAEPPPAVASASAQPDATPTAAPLAEAPPAVAEPPPTPEPRKVIVTTTGEYRVLMVLEFEYGASRLPKSSRVILDGVAAVLRENAGVTRVAVAGHTSLDEKAGARLGEARAKAVIAALTTQGIDAERLVPEGHGSDQPIADNATLEGRARNRRVQFKVLEQRACATP